MLAQPGQLADGITDDWLPSRSGVAAFANRSAAPMALAFGFFTFIPYPALNLGSASAIQIGNVLTLIMCVPILFMPLNRQCFGILPMLMAPLLISALKISYTGEGDPALCCKSMISLALPCFTILATQIFAPRYALKILTGIAIAMLLHTVVGMWQLYSFSHGVFPIPELYVNQSFLSVQDNAVRIARYTQRPFGIFPEPSAMSSSLAPFILLFLALQCGIVRLRDEPARWQRIIFTLSAAGGLALIIFSRSGHSAITLAGLFMFGLIWLKRCKANMQTYLVLVVVLAVVVPIVGWQATVALSDRLGGDSAVGNSSWEERSNSLIIGFHLLTDGDMLTAICGLGCGLTAPALWDIARIDAVFSVLLTYIYETGMIGLLVICWIGVFIGRIWKSQNFDLTFAAIMAAWLVGVILTTSYSQLLPLWVALGWVTVWPDIFVSAEDRRRLAA